MFLLSFRSAATLARTMASIVDSEAHFSQRLVELGLESAFCDSLKTGGVKTLSHLAFALGQPNQVVSNDEFGQFLRTLVGRDPTIQETSSIKRLTFEAQTYVISVLRQGLDQHDETAPRRVAHAEGTTRMQALQTSLTGLRLTGELDPAHVLLDRASAMYDQNVVKYLEPSSCISRSHEIQGRKESKELSLEKGALVLKNPNEKLTSPTDTELKMHYATQRRGLAFQFANLMTYAQHNEWLTFLIEALHRESPPGYQRPSLAQLLQCDRAAWTRLSSTLNSVRQQADGSYPLGDELLKLRSDPNITLYLSPVVKPSNASSESSSWRAHPYSFNKPEPHQAKGKSKGKGKGKASAPSMPQELRGKWYKTAAGEPLCFGYNLHSGCNHSKTVKDGERCPKGWHLCCEPKCQGAHPLFKHGKQSN